MKRSSWLYAGFGALAAAGLLAWAFAPRPTEVEVATVSRGPFQTTVEEDGKTRLRERYVISAPLAGQLMRLSLREGDRVEADAVVATVLPALPALLDERSLRGQQERLEVTEAQMQRAQARLGGAKLALTQARNDAARSEQLARQGFVSSTKLDADRLSALAAQKELDAAVQERHAADHEVQQARAALMVVRTPQAGRSRSFALRAPVSGRVLRVMQGSEATVALGTPLLELGDTRSLEIVAELLTTDALRVPPDAPVVIERWGGGGPLQGRVRRVEPSAFTKVSALGVEEQRVKVLIDITSPPAQWAALGDGYRVGVRIETMALADAVQVPVSAVFPLPAGSDAGNPGMAVFRIEGGRAHLTPVEIGARNGSHAWVRRGLKPGTVVIVYPPAAVADDARVKPRKA